MKRWLLRFILLSLIGWGFGLLWFSERISHNAESLEQSTDAIIVLTGGIDRVPTGLSLLAEGRAQRLFISGVHEHVKVKELIAQASPNERDRIKLSQIDLGYAAENTTQNAQETARWVHENNIQTLRLVTANYHMPRSLLEFSLTLPHVKIIPHPIFPKRFYRKEWWQFSPTFNLVIREYHKFLGALGRYCIKKFKA